MVFMVRGGIWTGSGACSKCGGDGGLPLLGVWEEWRSSEDGRVFTLGADSDLSLLLASPRLTCALCNSRQDWTQSI